MAKNLPFPNQESGKRLHELAPEIARALGAEWSYDSAKHHDPETGAPYTWATLVHTPSGMPIGLHLNWYEGRLVINGEYNETDSRNRRIDTPYNFDRPKMGIDPMRGAEVIARDMSRRFLPAARAAWGVYMQRVNETRADQSNQAALADRLCATGIVRKARENGGSDGPRLYLHKNNVDWHGDIRATSESVTIELRYLNEAQALRVLRALEEG